MELQLKNREISYLEPVILECRNLEQTRRSVCRRGFRM